MPIIDTTHFLFLPVSITSYIWPSNPITMRLLLTALCITASASLSAQSEFIAPEGKILNYRTLTWADFQQKEEKEFADKLAERNLMARAYVCPSIYFKADSGKTQDNGRVKFSFHVKCAFQSKAFVRESTKEEHSNYVLTHEQDHYDIALTYANKLQADLSGKDYNADKYSDEIDKVYNDLIDKYQKTQQVYDGEVNPDGKDDKAKQSLWDMRIKKGLENNTVDYYSSAEAVVQSVKALGQTVKRIPREPALQFVVRARPLYSEFLQEMTSKIVETKEWTAEPSIIAFYSQRLFEDEGTPAKESYRTLAYIFIPNGQDSYKRVVIDTFVSEGKPAKITATFLANADSDQVKELIIMATATQKGDKGQGTVYMNRVYDNTGRLLPGKLKRLEDPSAKIAGGLDGTIDGKTSKPKYKTEKEVADALKKLGYN